jgi:hypothetical protein
MLDWPSGLGKITVLTCASLWESGVVEKEFDMTGTTNEEAIKKLMKYYNTPDMREVLGDHVFFEGLNKHKEKPRTYWINLGS